MKTTKKDLEKLIEDIREYCQGWLRLDRPQDNTAYNDGAKKVCRSITRLIEQAGKGNGTTGGTDPNGEAARSRK